MPVVFYGRKRQARMRLFCFAYAGGGIAAFNSWDADMPDFVQVGSVERPGHDSLVGQPPLTTLTDTVREIVNAILPHLDRPYAIFGHSLGALLGYEVCRALSRRSCTLPCVLMVASHPAPHVRTERVAVHHLPDSEFRAELDRLNGSTDSVLADPELRALMLPASRADFALHHDYEFVPGELLACPIIAYGGLEDEEVSRSELEAWADLSIERFSLRLFPGGHFFLNSARATLLTEIASKLSSIGEFRGN